MQMYGIFFRDFPKKPMYCLNLFGLVSFKKHPPASGTELCLALLLCCQQCLGRTPKFTWGKMMEHRREFQRADSVESISGWCFQMFFIFTPTWGNDPIWLIFFKGLKPPTTSRFDCSINYCLFICLFTWKYLSINFLHYVSIHSLIYFLLAVSWLHSPFFQV